MFPGDRGSAPSSARYTPSGPVTDARARLERHIAHQRSAVAAADIGEALSLSAAPGAHGGHFLPPSLLSYGPARVSSTQDAAFSSARRVSFSDASNNNNNNFGPGGGGSEAAAALAAATDYLSRHSPHRRPSLSTSSVSTSSPGSAHNTNYMSGSHSLSHSARGSGGIAFGFSASSASGSHAPHGYGDGGASRSGASPSPRPAHGHYSSHHSVSGAGSSAEAAHGPSRSRGMSPSSIASGHTNRSRYTASPSRHNPSHNNINNSNMSVGASAAGGGSSVARSRSRSRSQSQSRLQQQQQQSGSSPRVSSLIQHGSGNGNGNWTSRSVPGHSHSGIAPDSAAADTIAALSRELDAAQRGYGDALSMLRSAHSLADSAIPTAAAAAHGHYGFAGRAGAGAEYYTDGGGGVLASGIPDPASLPHTAGALLADLSEARSDIKQLRQELLAREEELQRRDELLSMQAQDLHQTKHARVVIEEVAAAHAAKVTQLTRAVSLRDETLCLLQREKERAERAVKDAVVLSQAAGERERVRLDLQAMTAAKVALKFAQGKGSGKDLKALKQVTVVEATEQDKKDNDEDDLDATADGAAVQQSDDEGTFALFPSLPLDPRKKSDAKRLISLFALGRLNKEDDGGDESNGNNIFTNMINGANENNASAANKNAANTNSNTHSVNSGNSSIVANKNNTAAASVQSNNVNVPRSSTAIPAGVTAIARAGTAHGGGSHAAAADAAASVGLTLGAGADFWDGDVTDPHADGAGGDDHAAESAMAARGSRHRTPGFGQTPGCPYPYPYPYPPLLTQQPFLPVPGAAPGHGGAGGWQLPLPPPLFPSPPMPVSADVAGGVGPRLIPLLPPFHMGYHPLLDSNNNNYLSGDGNADTSINAAGHADVSGCEPGFGDGQWQWGASDYMGTDAAAQRQRRALAAGAGPRGLGFVPLPGSAPTYSGAQGTYTGDEAAKWASLGHFVPPVATNYLDPDTAPYTTPYPPQFPVAPLTSQLAGHAYSALIPTSLAASTAAAANPGVPTLFSTLPGVAPVSSAGAATEPLLGRAGRWVGARHREALWSEIERNVAENNELQSAIEKRKSNNNSGSNVSFHSDVARGSNASAGLSNNSSSVSAAALSFPQQQQTTSAQPQTNPTSQFQSQPQAPSQSQSQSQSQLQAQVQAQTQSQSLLQSLQSELTGLDSMYHRVLREHARVRDGFDKLSHGIATVESDCQQQQQQQQQKQQEQQEQVESDQEERDNQDQGQDFEQRTSAATSTSTSTSTAEAGAARLGDRPNTSAGYLEGDESEVYHNARVLRDEYVKQLQVLEHNIAQIQHRGLWLQSHITVLLQQQEQIAQLQA